jgi:ATP synthase protein I
VTGKEPERRPDERELEERVAAQVRRIKRAKKEQYTLIGYTVYLGTLGLLFVLPVLVGAYVGRWLDQLSSGYSVHWTLGLLLLGVVVGAVNVYFFIRE